MDEERRWRTLLSMAVDLAFETDAWGRLVFLTPDDVLGWPAGSLIGKPAELLLASPGSIAGFNPFRAATPVRRRRAWLNRAGGGHVCLKFTCAPLLGAGGIPAGTRGIATLAAAADDDAGAGYAPGRVLDRPAFVSTLSRQLRRANWGDLPGTLMHTSVEGFDALQTRLGPERAEAVLATVAALLIDTLRPHDLITSMGDGSFLLWMSGADHMTAAERADALGEAVPLAVADAAGPDAPPVGVAIGIAPRQPGDETIEMLMRRAERALAMVREGGTGWLVAHVTDP